MPKDKCEAVTISVADNGFIVEPRWPWKPTAPGEPPSEPRRPRQYVAETREAALKRAGEFLGADVDVTPRPEEPMAKTPGELYED